LSIIADPDYGDITDPSSGRDVAVEFKTAEETGKSFPSTSIRVKPNQTPITEDASVLEAIKESQKNITEIYQERSYDELTQALNDYLNGGTESTEKTKEEAKTSSKASSYNSKETSDAFDDLFNS
jgi:histidinol-phosphate/aromatic aminotransferase/cobyric acid decarboxylase-like protein